MSRKSRTEIAEPTISAVLAEFLEAERARLSSRTFARYRDAIELLQHSLDGYAYQYLDKEDSALFDRLYNAEGEEHREFCEMFGPEHILPNLREFLYSFMIRKVIGGKDLLRVAGTANRRLAAWLAEQGYVTKDEAREAAQLGREAARDLPAASDLAHRLFEFAQRNAPRVEEDDVAEGYFDLTRVEDRKIWLAGMDGEEIGPITVPRDISDCCKPEWTIAAMLGRFGNGWRFIEVWNVYPV